MIERSGRLNTVIFMVISLLIALGYYHGGTPAPISLLWGLLWVFGGLVTTFTIVLGSGFVMSVYSRTHPKANSYLFEETKRDYPSLSLLGWLLAACGEIAITVRTFLIYQPWRAKPGIFNAPHADSSSGSNPISTRPVLLLHGYMCNAGTWHNFKKEMDALGVTYSVISLDPPMGDIDGYVADVDRAIEELCNVTGSNQVWVIAHSMGGLVARAYVNAKGDDRIAAAISLGTPHQGTLFAPPGMGKNVQQMVIGSPWLQALSMSERDKAFRSKLTTVWTPQDNIVFPQVSALLPGSKVIEVNGSGHLALLENKQVHRIIGDWLGKPA